MRIPSVYSCAHISCRGSCLGLPKTTACQAVCPHLVPASPSSPGTLHVYSDRVYVCMVSHGGGRWQSGGRAARCAACQLCQWPSAQTCVYCRSPSDAMTRRACSGRAVGTIALGPRSLSCHRSVRNWCSQVSDKFENYISIAAQMQDTPFPRPTFHNTYYKSRKTLEVLFAVWLFIFHYQFHIRGGRATIVHLAIWSMFEGDGCAKSYLGLAG
jgi:hypothetical protein